MKINILNKTLIKSVALASCFAALSLSSAQAADIFYADGQDPTLHDQFVNATEGGLIHAHNGGRIDITDSILGSESGRFTIIADDNNGQVSWVSLYKTTIYADNISINSEKHLSQNYVFLMDSDVNVSNGIHISNNGRLELEDSNLKGTIHGYSNSKLLVINSNIDGRILNLSDAEFNGSNTWKSVGSSKINNLISSGDLTVDFYITDDFDTLSLSNVTGDVSVIVNFTDEFIEQYLESYYSFNMFATIVGDISNVNWDVAYSNGHYSWDVRSPSNGSFVIENITVIPEPSTYAMIFGILALGLAIYRKRK